MNMGFRIKYIRKYFKLSQKDFGEKLGISQSAVQVYEYEKSIPNAEVLARICQEFNVNPKWLLLGEGPPFGETKQTQGNSPYETILSEILDRIGYYENDFTQEQLIMLTNKVEKELKVMLWDLQKEIMVFVSSLKKDKR